MFARGCLFSQPVILCLLYSLFKDSSEVGTINSSGNKLPIGHSKDDQRAAEEAKTKEREGKRFFGSNRYQKYKMDVMHDDGFALLLNSFQVESTLHPPLVSPLIIAAAAALSLPPQSLY